MGRRAERQSLRARGLGEFCPPTRTAQAPTVRLEEARMGIGEGIWPAIRDSRRQPQKGDTSGSECLRARSQPGPRIAKTDAPPPEQAVVAFDANSREK